MSADVADQRSRTIIRTHFDVRTGLPFEALAPSGHFPARLQLANLPVHRLDLYRDVGQAKDPTGQKVEPTP
jgi:hypothetical protein